MQVMRACMKVSDVGHVSKAQRVHVRWTDLICEEMFRQGDEEKRLQLKVRRERERGCAERGGGAEGGQQLPAGGSRRRRRRTRGRGGGGIWCIFTSVVVLVFKSTDSCIYFLLSSYVHTLCDHTPTLFSPPPPPKVSPQMDRAAENSPKNQISFMNFCIRPLFDQLVPVWAAFEPLRAQVELNHQFWDSLRVRSSLSMVKGVSHKPRYNDIYESLISPAVPPVVVPPLLCCRRCYCDFTLRRKKPCSQYRIIT
jgi:hypothetical protein